MTCTCHPHRGVLAKQEFPPEVERAYREFLSDYEGAMDPIRRDLLDALRSGDFDPSSTTSIRAQVDAIVANYTSDIEIVFQDGGAAGALAGRELAARRFQLDISFDEVPQRVLDAFDDWSTEMTDEVLSTITEDTTRFIRSAHEEGLSIPDIAETVQEDLFDGRLQDWQAERTARTATISSSNAGTHSAYEDADSVVGEEWLATGDGRTRDTHGEADGQIVALDATFLVGGAEARYPGDPGLPVEEVANCRCRVIPVFASDLTADERARLEAGDRLNLAAPTTAAAAAAG